MQIAFTGHRNKQAAIRDIESITYQFPNAVWVHGGAIGFDSQVETFAKNNGINTIVITPDYAKYGKPAPLIRNRQIVDSAEILIACYDGRKSGGTYRTIQYARSKGKKVIIYAPDNTIP